MNFLMLTKRTGFLILLLTICALSFQEKTGNRLYAAETEKNIKNQTVVTSSNREFQSPMFNTTLPVGWIFSVNTEPTTGLSVILRIEYPKKVTENFTPVITITQCHNNNCITKGDWNLQSKKEFIAGIENEGYKKVYERKIRGKYGKLVHELIFEGNGNNPALNGIKMNASIIVGKNTFYAIQYANSDKYFKLHYKYYIKLLKSFEINDKDQE